MRRSEISIVTKCWTLAHSTQYRMLSLLLWLAPLLCLPRLPAVQISYKDICGNKLQDSCPNAVNTKIIGGTATCAEKVPWNVLVEKVTDRSEGNDNI